MADDVIFSVITSKQQQTTRCEHTWWGRRGCNNQPMDHRRRSRFCASHSCTGRDSIEEPCQARVVKTEGEPQCLTHYLQTLLRAVEEQKLVIAGIRLEQTYYEPSTSTYKRMAAAIYDLQHLSSMLHSGNIVIALLCIGMIDRQQAAEFLGERMPADQ